MIKKYTSKLMLTLLTLLVCSVANAGIKLSLSPLQGILPGNTYEVKVIVESDVELTSVGFDVTFPKGVAPVSVEKNEARAKGADWNCNITPAPNNPGAYTFGLMHFTKTIKAGSNEIATITVATGDVIEDGEMTIENVAIFKKGDQAATGDYESEGADVTTSDVYEGVMDFTAPESYEVYPGKEFKVEVSLTNDANLRAFECFIELPEGFSFVEDEDEEAIILGSDRKPAGCSFMFNEQTNKVGMLVTSKENISGNEGVLFSFTVKAPDVMPESSLLKIKKFTGSVENSQTSYSFDSDITIDIKNRWFLDYEDAKAAVDGVEGLQEALNAAKNDQDDPILKTIIDRQKETIDGIQADIDVLRAKANEQPLDPEFDLAAFMEEVAEVAGDIEDLRDAVKAAYDANEAGKEKLDGEIGDLQEALDAVAEDIAGRNEWVQGQVDGRVDAIQEDIDGLSEAVKGDYEGANLNEESVLPKNTVAADIEQLAKDVAAAQKQWDENEAAKERLDAQISPAVDKRLEEAIQNIKTSAPDVAAEFEEDIEDVQELIDALKDAVEEDYENVELTPESSVDEELDAIYDAIKAVEAAAAAAQTKFNDNKNGYLALNKDLDALKKGLEDAKKAIEEMENVTGEDFADEIKDIEDDIQALEDYLEERNANRELTLQSTLDAPDVTKKEVEDELAALNKAAAELNAARSFIAGDINKDGKVDSDDLALFINALSTNKLPAAGSEDFARYDANGNGVINIADAQAIFNLSLYGNAEGKK